MDLLCDWLVRGRWTYLTNVRHIRNLEKVINRKWLGRKVETTSEVKSSRLQAILNRSGMEFLSRDTGMSVKRKWLFYWLSVLFSCVYRFLLYLFLHWIGEKSQMWKSVFSTTISFIPTTPFSHFPCLLKIQPPPLVSFSVHIDTNFLKPEMTLKMSVLLLRSAPFQNRK